VSEIRLASERDWPDIYPFFAAIVAAGRQLCLSYGLSIDEARATSSRAVGNAVGASVMPLVLS
jgi:hypothetical protein